MVLRCLLVVVGYGFGALLTARAVFRRGRARFLRAGAAGAGGDGRWVGAFERQERQQAEALALCVGALWPVALPVVALHGLVGTVVLDRGRPGRAGRPDPRAVAARIDELERELRLDRHAGAGRPGTGAVGRIPEEGVRDVERDPAVEPR